MTGYQGMGRGVAAGGRKRGAGAHHRARHPVGEAVRRRARVRRRGRIRARDRHGQGRARSRRRAQPRHRQPRPRAEECRGPRRVRGRVRPAAPRRRRQGQPQAALRRDQPRPQVRAALDHGRQRAGHEQPADAGAGGQRALLPAGLDDGLGRLGSGRAEGQRRHGDQGADGGEPRRLPDRAGHPRRARLRHARAGGAAVRAVARGREPRAGQGDAHRAAPRERPAGAGAGRRVAVQGFAHAGDPDPGQRRRGPCGRLALRAPLPGQGSEGAGNRFRRDARPRLVPAPCGQGRPGQGQPGGQRHETGAGGGHFAERALSARLHRPRLQPGREPAQGIRRRAVAHRRRGQGVPRLRVRRAGAHQHAARGPPLPGECVPVFRGRDARPRHRTIGGAAARRRLRSAADRGQHVDRVLAEGRVAAAHRPRGHARRRAAARRPRVSGRRHPARRAHRPAGRFRPMHERAQSAQSGAGAARAARRAGRVGEPRRGTPRQPGAHDRRRHAGAARQQGLPRDSRLRGRALRQRDRSLRRLDAAEARPCAALRGAGGEDRRRRQRDRRHPAPRRRRPARDVHRVESLQAPVPGERAVRPRRQLQRVRRHQGRARGEGRSAPLGRGALRHARGVRAAGARLGGRAGRRRGCCWRRTPTPTRRGRRARPWRSGSNRAQPGQLSRR